MILNSYIIHIALSYVYFQGQIRSFFDCVKGLFDADTLKKEIEDAKPNGALDEVFKK